MDIARNKEVEVLDKEHPGFRIFVLGAGFSVPAGLPTAAELYPEVVKRVERLHGKDNRFHWALDRKSTRLNSSHVRISYAVFCLKKKRNKPSHRCRQIFYL